MSTDRNRDDERRQFESDVSYEAWSRGFNPDRAADCATDCYYDGRTPTECVDGYARQQRHEREARELAATEEEQMRADWERQCYANQESDEQSESGG